MRFTARLFGVDGLARGWQKFGPDLDALKALAVDVLKGYPRDKFPDARIEIAENVERVREVVRSEARV